MKRIKAISLLMARIFVMSVKRVCAVRSAWLRQDTSLLHRSVRENIVYGRPDASEEEIISAAERAEAPALFQR